MKPSSIDEVRKMYEETADSYAEIDLPMYSDVLGRLRERLGSTTGTLIDSACGSGHMLSMYHDRYDQSRQLLGIDLSPRMVAIAAEKLGSSARILVGDMRELVGVGEDEAAAILNFFAVHHLDPEGVHKAFDQWYRVLRPGGQLILATWEGNGTVDYGDESHVVAFRYSCHELSSWAQLAGFEITRCVVEPVQEISMDAILLEGVKE